MMKLLDERRGGGGLSRAPFAGLNRIRFQGSDLNPFERDTPGGSLTISGFGD
jgi:hypothetical protein